MSVWAKMWVWTKIAAFSAVSIYVLFFILFNTGADKQVVLWVWYNHSPSAPLLVVLPVTFLLGVITMLLTRTVFRTMRQMRDMKRRKMEKEAAAIITRAAKLRVRESQAGDGGRGFPVGGADETLP